MVKPSLIAILLALFLAGCDESTPPFIQNALTAPIEVSTTYTNSISTRDTWLPQMIVACGRADADISRMTIKADGRVIHRFGQADIAHMLHSVADARKVIWQVQRHSIVPVTVQ